MCCCCRGKVNYLCGVVSFIIWYYALCCVAEERFIFSVFRGCKVSVRMMSECFLPPESSDSFLLSFCQTAGVHGSTELWRSVCSRRHQQFDQSRVAMETEGNKLIDDCSGERIWSMDGEWMKDEERLMGECVCLQTISLSIICVVKNIFWKELYFSAMMH